MKQLIYIHIYRSSPVIQGDVLVLLFLMKFVLELLDLWRFINMNRLFIKLWE